MILTQFPIPLHGRHFWTLTVCNADMYIAAEASLSIVKYNQIITL